ncbi:MAG: hypothetical protein WCT52_01200 [Candidatus Micrarchaeia archaeon]
MPKAQGSTELLAILGVALIYVLFFAIFASSSVLDLQTQKDLREAQSSASQLAETADYVLSQGDGASSAVLITLPPSVNFSTEKTYIGKPPSAGESVPSNTININIKDINAVAYTRALLTGAFPSSSGTHSVNVTSHGTFVNIGEEPISAAPSVVYVQMSRSQNILSYVVFTSHFVYPIFVNITPSWVNTGPSLSISPSQFVLFNGTSTVQLNFTSDAYDGGAYTGLMSVATTSLGSPSVQMNFTVPITARVQET